MNKILLGIIISLGAVSAVNAAESLSGNAPKIDQQMCQNAWSQSSASRTCIATVVHVGGDQCNAGARCDVWNGSYFYPVSTAITTSFSNFKNLSNCDGHLKVGSC